MKSYFRKLRLAYNRGWRAGMCGTPHLLACPFNPYRQFLLYYMWDTGWYNGMVESLKRHLNRKRA